MVLAGRRVGGSILVVIALAAFACGTASALVGSQAVPDPPILVAASVDAGGVLVVTGTTAGAADAVITVYADGLNVGTGSGDGAGNFNFAVPSFLPTGLHAVTVTVTVDGFQSGPSNAITVQVSPPSAAAPPPESTPAVAPDALEITPLFTG